MRANDYDNRFLIALLTRFKCIKQTGARIRVNVKHTRNPHVNGTHFETKFKRAMLCIYTPSAFVSFFDSAMLPER